MLEFFNLKGLVLIHKKLFVNKNPDTGASGLRLLEI